MKKSKNLLLFLIVFVAITMCLTFLISCNNEDDADTDQKTVKIDKHGVVEVKITQRHLDSAVIVETNKYYYDNAGKLISTKVNYDTVSALGIIRDTLDTGRTYEDENGDEQEIDTVITHKKNYQFYISVK